VELRDFAVKMVSGVMQHNGSQGAVIRSVAEELGLRAETVCE
jgi:hypothetical protein